ncbi:MAG: hypothetical protein EZS28_023567 [Streblomastix strix]|uniref:Uncharacterized protein n=1 Tax=Streblomastix strix TaxID=222440 RepID=A0A5J4VEE6_9EUKA|nr:MAG: hypothetical protein EZS28_023567 [Streblomastix strix]
MSKIIILLSILLPPPQGFPPGFGPLPQGFLPGFGPPPQGFLLGFGLPPQRLQPQSDIQSYLQIRGFGFGAFGGIEGDDYYINPDGDIVIRLLIPSLDGIEGGEMEEIRL